MLSAKEVHLRKIPNLVSKIVGIVAVTIQPSRNHVQRLARNVFIAESPIISKYFAILNMMAGVQAIEVVNGVPGLPSKWSIHKILSDNMRIYLFSTRLLPSQERRVKSTAQWKLMANQLNIKSTLVLNVMR